MLTFLSSLKAEQALPSGKAEVPVTLLWVLVYLAQHYDRKGEHQKALEFIDEAIRWPSRYIHIAHLCTAYAARMQALELIEEAIKFCAMATHP